MGTRKPQAAKAKAKAAAKSTPPPPPDAFGDVPRSQASDDQVEASNLSLHDLFARQAMTMLDRTDLDEEQKQNILVAMNCPCCGSGGMSFTAKIKRRR